VSQRLVECVPNFSEGRDCARIDAILAAIRGVAGVELLDVDPGADTNRTVVTFVGAPEAAVEAAFRAIKKASEVIDMRQHSGAHPRMGATDVCPFVPVSGMTLEDCAALARELGARVGAELGLPVYLYESAAAKPERRNLASVRKGEYEGLADKLQDPAWAPDFGPAAFHAAAGATIIGAREFLIAYNITLNTRDKALATDIAFELREKGRVARRGQTNARYDSGEVLFYREGAFPCGNCAHDAATFEALEAHCRDAHGYELRALLALNDIDAAKGVIGKKAYRAGLFRACKAIGWYVDEYKRAQLSINLTDYKVTPPQAVFDATRELAAARGLVVTGSEIVGVVPHAALLDAGRHYLRLQGKSPFVPDEDILQCAVFSLGLNDVAPFDLPKKVLGLPARDGALARMAVGAFTDEVSRDTPAPGGGSIAALAGALGAGLASMVANLTQGRAGAEEGELLRVARGAQALKDELLRAVDADTEAFNAYMEARRRPQGTPAEKAARAAAMLDGLKAAVAVPLRTAEASLEALHLAAAAAAAGNPASLTDALVGAQMAFAGLRGGLWNVRINLKDIDDPVYCADMAARCDALLAEGEAALAAVTAAGDARLAGSQGA
jgi:glutamate formiminotransferase/formiminotetrahydrofolate cyclodeaminase